MFADTAAIGAAGVDLIRTAADLESVAATLPAAGPAAATLGPVGAQFLSALTSALNEAAHEATRLGADLAGAADTAEATAAAYVDTEHRSIVMLGG